MTGTFLAPPPVALRTVAAATPTRNALAWVDAACFASAAAVAVHVAGGFDSPLRPLAALVFALFVPGWIVVRWFRLPLSTLSVALAVAGSLCTFILIGELLVLATDWRWRSTGAVLSAGCAVLAVPWLRVPRWPGRGVRLLRRRATAQVALVSISSGWLTVLIGLSRSRRSDFGHTGLVGALSPAYWVGVAIIGSGSAYLIARGSRFAWWNLAALLVALHGLPGLLERHPRFNVAWVHVGFIDQIAERGELLRGLDARFSWAGFFAGGGLLQNLAGTGSLLWLVRFAPIFYNALALLLLVSIGRRLGFTGRQVLVAAHLYVVLNWIGQDYLAPQATAYLLYWAVIAMVLEVRSGIAAGWLRPVAVPPRRTAAARTVAAVVACHLIVLAIVISHQLTPGFLASALVLLAATGTVRIRALPWFVVMAFLLWLSFGADAYWLGHFDNLAGSVGQVGDLVDQNVSQRTAPATDPGREFVVRTRVAVALAMWVLAGTAVLVGWWRRRAPVALACLLAAPFPMLLLQPYGGEMILRVCYFTVLPAALLIAGLVVPARELRRPKVAACSLAVVLAVLAPLFVTARFGNEAFEAFADTDVALSRAMYEVVPDGSTVYVATHQTLLYFERVDSVRFRDLPGGSADERSAEIASTLDDGERAFVLLTGSQAAHGVVSLSRSPGWLRDLERDLVATGRYVERLRDGDAVLLELVR